MATTPVVLAAMRKLTTLLTEDSELGGANPPVRVTLGWPKGGLVGDWCFVAAAVDDWSNTPPLPGTTQQEATFTLQVFAGVTRRGVTFDQLADRLFDLGAAVDRAVSESRFLGTIDYDNPDAGAIQYAYVSGGEIDEVASDEKTRQAGIRLDIKVTAWRA